MRPTILNAVANYIERFEDNSCSGDCSRGHLVLRLRRVSMHIPACAMDVLRARLHGRSSRLVHRRWPQNYYVSDMSALTGCASSQR